MGVIPVRALDSIKRGGIGGVANNPVEFWITRNGLADSTLSKRFTFLAEDFQSKWYTMNSTSLPLTGSSPEIQNTLRPTAATKEMMATTTGIGS